MREYVVQPGDTLQKIAIAFLGPQGDWRVIVQANNIVDPRQLRPGTRLRIPNAAPPTPAAPISNSGTSRSTAPTASRTPTAQPLNSPQPPYITQLPPTAPRSPQPVTPPAPTASRSPQPTTRSPQPPYITQAPPTRPSPIAPAPVAPAPVTPAPVAPAPVTPAPVAPAPVAPAPVASSAPYLEYTVKSGDTLAKIARETLGPTGDWQEIAQLNKIAHPSQLQIGMRLLIPNPVGSSPGTPVTPIAPKGDEVPVVLNTSQGSKSLARRERVEFTTQGKTVLARYLTTQQQDPVGQNYELGLYRSGEYSPREFINRSRQSLREISLTDSEINVIAAVAQNEGALDAINTWDSQFISFGIFQWTAGGFDKNRNTDMPGELGGLLNRIKQRFPEEYQHYFAQFGLDVADANATTGRLTLNGQRFSSESQKNILRQPLWAYRFALAGRDTRIQAMQILHAVTRIDRFYFNPQSSLGNLPLSNLLTSEFAVALLLDNHVNRPSFVVPCVVEALKNLKMSAAQLAQGTQQDEQQVIEAYLTVRETYGPPVMTHAKQRADRVRRNVQSGTLSDRRGSFVSGRLARGSI